MKKGLLILLLSLLLLEAKAEPLVVTSLKPIHSLVAGVMGPVGEPVLLIKGAASPHGHSLRPSQIRLIHEAQAIFWIGETLESFLEKPLANAQGRHISLLEAPDIALLKIRPGGTWEDHEHGHEHGDEHDVDTHIWLNPQNAITMVHHITTVLIEIDPTQRTEYEQNSAQLLQRLQDLDQDLATRLKPLADIPFLVFHDAYQYLEQRYGLNGSGTVLVNPEHRPGAKRLRTIRAHIREYKARCLFSEPQFKPALIDTLTQDSDIGRGLLDPLGATIPAGSEAYFQLMEALAAALEDCLSATSPPVLTPPDRSLPELH